MTVKFIDVALVESNGNDSDYSEVDDSDKDKNFEPDATSSSSDDVSSVEQLTFLTVSKKRRVTNAREEDLQRKKKGKTNIQERRDRNANRNEIRDRNTELQKVKL